MLEKEGGERGREGERGKERGGERGREGGEGERGKGEREGGRRRDIPDSSELLHCVHCPLD